MRYTGSVRENGCGGAEKGDVVVGRREAGR